MNKLYINGAWADAQSGKTHQVVNPATEEIIDTIPFAGRADVDLAISAAQHAFSEWKHTNAFERGKILKRIADKIRLNAKEFAIITTKESGKPLAESTGEWMIAADLFEWFGEEAKRTYGTVIPAGRNNKRMQVIWQSIGVVGIITAWNFPVWNLARPIGAALAAGCPVVLKPSNETPLTAMALAKLIDEEGLPKGTFNLVAGKSSEIGDALMYSPEIKKVHFVGSTQIGKMLMDKASKTNTKLSLELGGNAPVVIFPDVDVKKVAAASVLAKFRNCGQVCISPQRFIVHKDIYEEFTKEAAKVTAAYNVGNGLDEASQIGPMISKAQQINVVRLFEESIEDGAKVLAGGETYQVEGKGYFFKPTLLSEVTVNTAAFKEEVFGPIMPVMSFETTEEAIELANRSEYGLAAYIWTNDLTTAIKVSEEIEAGIVGINEWSAHATEAPFGGIKQSGQGSELGHDGVFEYMEKKLISIGSL